MEEKICCGTSSMLGSSERIAATSGDSVGSCVVFKGCEVRTDLFVLVADSR